MTYDQQLERCIRTAKEAGCPKDQVESLVSKGYIPFPCQWCFHAAARSADEPDGPVDIGAGGARGPGKSHVVLSQVALDDCQRVPGLKCLFLRQTGISAQESFDDLISKTVRGRTKYHKIKTSLRFPNGSTILLGGFKDEGDAILLLGETKEELGGSEYLTVIHRRKAGRPPRVDLAGERALQQLMVELAARGFVKSAHDCSDGGLAVALVESCIIDGEHRIGARIVPPQPRRLRTDAWLFGESAGRIVISCAQHHVESIEHLARRHTVPASLIGRVGGSRFSVDPWIDAPVEELSNAWRSGLRKAFESHGRIG